MQLRRLAHGAACGNETCACLLGLQSLFNNVPAAAGRCHQGPAVLPQVCVALNPHSALSVADVQLPARHVRQDVLHHLGDAGRALLCDPRLWSGLAPDVRRKAAGLRSEPPLKGLATVPKLFC